MMIREFLETLAVSDVKLWLEGDVLRCNAPKGVLTPEVQASIKARKPEILAFLRAGLNNDSPIVPIQPKGSLPPFIGLPGHNGDVFCYVPLAQHLGDDQPFYGLQPPGFNGEQAPYESVPKLAAHYVAELRENLPRPAYYVGGYCAGGAIAFEVAQQLSRAGAEVPLLALFDAPFPTAYLPLKKAATVARYLVHRIPDHLNALANTDGRVNYIRDRLRAAGRAIVQSGRRPAAPQDGIRHRTEVANATVRAVREYRPGLYSGDMDLFMACDDSLKRNYGRQRLWERSAAGGFRLHIGPEGCTSAAMLQEPWVEHFAGLLKGRLNGVPAGPDSGENGPNPEMVVVARDGIGAGTGIDTPWVTNPASRETGQK